MQAQLIGIMLLAALPAGAQTMLKAPPVDTSQPRQRLVTVFGTDICPKPSGPDEIVVCTRLSDVDRYRIPAQVRAGQPAPRSATGTNRKLVLGDSSGGAGGSIGSCSTVGPGGSSGCQFKANEAWGGVPR